jgi:hypothetical protein
MNQDHYISIVQTELMASPIYHPSILLPITPESFVSCSRLHPTSRSSSRFHRLSCCSSQPRTLFGRLKFAGISVWIYTYNTSLTHCSSSSALSTSLSSSFHHRTHILVVVASRLISCWWHVDAHLTQQLAHCRADRHFDLSLSPYQVYTR